jgi:hypothetical protein
MFNQRDVWQSLRRAALLSASIAPAGLSMRCCAAQGADSPFYDGGDTLHDGSPYLFEQCRGQYTLTARRMAVGLPHCASIIEACSSTKFFLLGW